MKKIGLFCLIFCGILIISCTEEEIAELLETRTWYWINDYWDVGPSSYKYSSYNLFYGDQIHIFLDQTVGDYIAEVFIADEDNFRLWQKDETFYPIFYKRRISGGEWTVKVPRSGKYYFVIYNDALIVTIRVKVKVEITR